MFSSTPEFIFEFTDPSLQGEMNSNMNLGVLELKLHKVHLADKFSKAELARLRRIFLQSAPCAVFIQMSTRRQPSTPRPSLRGEAYLVYLCVDIGMTDIIGHKASRLCSQQPHQKWLTRYKLVLEAYVWTNMDQYAGIWSIFSESLDK